MKYKIVKENKPTLTTFGKYKAVASHQRTVSNMEILKEVCEQHPYDEPLVNAIMMRLSDVVSRHLRAGDIVQLREWGRLKLEIESEKVDDPKQFRAQKHIRGVRLHLIPESEGGRPELYKGITFERDKSSDI